MIVETSAQTSSGHLIQPQDWLIRISDPEGKGRTWIHLPTLQLAIKHNKYAPWDPNKFDVSFSSQRQRNIILYSEFNYTRAGCIKTTLLNFALFYLCFKRPLFDCKSPHLLHLTAMSNISLHCICLVLPLTRTLELLQVRCMACITSTVAKPMANKDKKKKKRERFELASL